MANIVVTTSTPQLVGYIVHCLLYGMLSVQCFVYYLAFPNDARLNKSLVLSLYLLDTAQWICNVNDNFNIYGRHFTSLDAFDYVRTSWLNVVVMGGLGSCGIQLFFCYRIWQLQKSWFMAGLIVAASLTQFFAAMVTGGFASQCEKYSDFTSTVAVRTGVWLVFSALCDVLIGVTMTYFLATRNAHFKATKVMIQKIIRMSLETGLLTAAVVLLNAVLFIGFRQKTYYVAPAQVMLKIYSNSCMAVLNSRVRIVGGRSDSGEDEDIPALSPSSAPGANEQSRGRRLNNRPSRAIGIHTSPDVSRVIKIGREAWDGGANQWSSQMDNTEDARSSPATRDTENGSKHECL